MSNAPECDVHHCGVMPMQAHVQLLARLGSLGSPRTRLRLLLHAWTLRLHLLARPPPPHELEALLQSMGAHVERMEVGIAADVAQLPSSSGRHEPGSSREQQAGVAPAAAPLSRSDAIGSPSRRSSSKHRRSASKSIKKRKRHKSGRKSKKRRRRRSSSDDGSGSSSDSDSSGSGLLDPGDYPAAAARGRKRGTPASGDEEEEQGGCKGAAAAAVGAAGGSAATAVQWAVVLPSCGGRVTGSSADIIDALVCCALRRWVLRLLGKERRV